MRTPPLLPRGEGVHGGERTQSRDLSDRDLRRGDGDRARRFRLRPGCRGRLAAHPVTVANRDADHVLWPRRARILGVVVRHALRWQRLWPFLVGAAIGLPLGVAVLRYTNPGYVRIGVGIVLILFS